MIVCRSAVVEFPKCVIALSMIAVGKDALSLLQINARGGWNASRDQRFYMGNVHKNDKYESRGC